MVRHPPSRQRGIAPRIGPIGTAGALLVVSAAMFIACDNNANFQPIPFNFKELQIVSAVAAIEDAGAWRPLCGKESNQAGEQTLPDGFILNALFLTYSRDQLSEDADADVSLRPFDLVNKRQVQGAADDDIDLTNTSNYSSTLDCLETSRHLDSSESAPFAPPTNQCDDGYSNPTVQLDSVAYKQFTADRSVGHNVLVLLDQSGSTKGLVDDVTKKEGKNISNFGSNFQSLASDYYDLRHTAAQQFISTLNSADSVGIIGFGEGIEATDNLMVPCQSPYANTGQVENDLNVCFGTDRQMWTGAECQAFDPDGEGPLSYAASDLACHNGQCQRTGTCEGDSSYECMVDSDCVNACDTLTNTCTKSPDVACAASSDCEAIGPCSGVPELWSVGASWFCGGFGGALGTAKMGRSNLWTAVDRAYSYLSGEVPGSVATTVSDTSRSRHIVVIGDGPDTCDAKSATYASCEVSGRCGDTDLTDIISRIDADIDNPNKTPVTIHFVQFESQGYRGRDPRQVEVSCLTGGHYQFINSETMSKAQTTNLQQALNQAVMNVRHSLMGYWQFAHKAPVLSENGKMQGGGTPPGSLFAFGGILNVKEEMNLEPASKKPGSVIQPYGVGRGEGAKDAPNWDRRPTIGKACAAPTDCVFSDAANGTVANTSECHIVCSDETNLCPGGLDGAQKRDSAQCSSGACCGGTCQSDAAECLACEDE
jgi:hypothetical protein